MTNEKRTTCEASPKEEEGAVANSKLCARVMCICLLVMGILCGRQRGVYSVRSQAAPRALRTLVRVVGVSVEEQGVEVFVTQNQRKTLGVCPDILFCRICHFSVTHGSYFCRFFCNFCPFPKMNLIGSVFHTVLAFLMLFGLCFIIELLELSNVS